jgi:hypothetical protein
MIMAEPDDRIWNQFITERDQAPHAINLFDLQQKYADVALTAEVIAHLRSLPSPAVQAEPHGR